MSLPASHRRLAHVSQLAGCNPHVPVLGDGGNRRVDDEVLTGSEPLCASAALIGRSDLDGQSNSNVAGERHHRRVHPATRLLEMQGPDRAPFDGSIDAAALREGLVKLCK